MEKRKHERRRGAKVPRRAFIASIIKVAGNVNADVGVGTRIPLKKILTWNQEIKAFVSARCIRRCIRERLFEKGFKIDPLQLIGSGAEQQLGDVGDPIEYIDDDLFGYLVPEEVPRHRASPIKISHLISLTHTEIKPEFAARFPRNFLNVYQTGYPAPFEVEIAEWLGRLEVIVSDRIGCFTEDELSREQKTKVEKREKYYYLSLEKRKERLKAFLEVLLWEGWRFPRAAQSSSIPEFYYTVIALTQRFIPIFGYIDVKKDGELSQDRISNLVKLYGNIIDHLFVLNYRLSQCQVYGKKEKGTLEAIKSEEMNTVNIGNIIDEICNYVVL